MSFHHNQGATHGITRQEKNPEEAQMRLIIIWCLWLSVFYGSAFFPDFYFDHFNIGQCAVAFGMMLAVLWLGQKSWWSELFSYICVLQLIMNIGDAAMDYPPENYLQYQSLLNLAEVLSLTAGPVLTYLYRKLRRGESDRIGTDRHMRRSRLKQV